MDDNWIDESIKDILFEDVYDIGKELGKGNVSAVHKCQHRGTGQQWAVKIINKAYAKRTAGSDNVGILLKLDHPNVIRLKEVYETPSHIHMLNELVTGGELFDRIVTQGYYSEKDIATSVRCILQAVKFLHDNDVVHRDIKPENVLYSSNAEDTQLKIADFGLSQIVSGYVHMNTVCATPGYCAPEVLKCNTYDKAVDLWSVGVMTFTLLCGSEPFYDESEAVIFKKILKCDYDFNIKHWENISENAKDFVQKLIVTDPKKRLTAGKALMHPWVHGNSSAKTVHMQDTQEAIKEYNRKRKHATSMRAVIMVEAESETHPAVDVTETIDEEETQLQDAG